MCKKLLVFLLTFWVGLIFSKLLIEDNIKPFESQKQITNGSDFIRQNRNSFNSDEAGIIKSASQKTDRFTGAGVETDQEVIDFFLKFQKAVAENDKKTVASLMIYPLRVNFPTDDYGKGYTFINNQKSFLKVYDKIFNKKVKEFIAQINVASEDDLWARYDGITTRHGEIWIGVFCNKRLCEDNKYHINIRTIHGNSFCIIK